jgi:hypothetical protein
MLDKFAMIFEALLQSLLDQGYIPIFSSTTEK